MFAVALLLALTPLPAEVESAEPLPPLSDLVRFPEADTVKGHVETLARQNCALHFQPKSAERDAAIQQMKHVRKCWRALQSAHGTGEDKVSDRTRRQALEGLRHLIGDGDYRRGRMP
jgi:hypothetical protein